ncbi:MAG: hypothetical protein ACRCV3_02590 [Desulfovibrionaceae bacterium]
MLSHGMKVDILSKDFDLKKALKEDYNGNVLRVVIDTLKEAEVEIRKTIDQGLSSEDFVPCSLLKQSYEIAQSNIQLYWKLAICKYNEDKKNTVF